MLSLNEESNGKVFSKLISSGPTIVACFMEYKNNLKYCKSLFNVWPEKWV